MLIIIYPQKNDKCFLRRFKENEYIKLKDVCELKKIKDKELIILINCECLGDDGIIKDYNFMIDEIFIIRKIRFVISINSNKKIEEVTSFFNVPLINI